MSDIVEKTTTDLALVSMFEEDSRHGFETMGAQDVSLPFITILQSNSPQCDRTKDEYRKDCEQGMFFDTARQVPMDGAERGIYVIPCFYIRQVLEWKPDRAGLAAIHPENTPLLKNTTKNEKGQDVLGNGNILSNTAQYFCKYSVDKEEWFDAVISMTSTALKHSRRWNTSLNSNKMIGRDGRPFILPIYSHVWKFTTTTDSNNKGSWFTWNIESDTILEDEELYKACRKLYEDASRGLVTAKVGGAENVPF